MSAPSRKRVPSMSSRVSALMVTLLVLVAVSTPLAIVSLQGEAGDAAVDAAVDGGGDDPDNPPRSYGGDADYPDESEQPQIDQDTLGQTFGFEDYVIFDNEDRHSSATEQCDSGECVSGSVLARLAPGTALEDAVAMLNRIVGLEGTEAVKQTDSYVEFALPEGLAVQDAINLMQDAASVTNVQANFVYRLFDETGAGATSDEAVAGEATSGEAGEGVTAGGLAAGAVADTLAIGGTGDHGGVLIDSQAVSLSYPPNDTKWSGQWQLNGAPYGMGIKGAWDAVSSRSSSSTPVVIAVIDAGFYTAHSDFANGSFVYPYNVVEGTSNVGTDNHGTHVAGIIAANTNNSQGIAGVTYNQCRIMPIKAADNRGGSSTADLIDAFEYIHHMKKNNVNVRVTNISMGHASNSVGVVDTLFNEAVNEVYRDGVVTVAAAGNNEDPIPYYEYPGDFDCVVSVINTDTDGSRRASSNYNVHGQRSKGISAPGTAIISTITTNYDTYSGTSMAAPAVAGVMGLMFTVDPGLTPDMAISKLYSSAVSAVAWSDDKGYGRVNAADAVSLGYNYPYIIGSPAMFAGKTQQVKMGYATAVSRYERSTGVQWSSSDPSVVSVSPASGGTATLTARSAGEVTITAKYSGNAASQTVRVYDSLQNADIAGPDIVPAGNTSTFFAYSYPVSEWTYSSSSSAAGAINATTGEFTANGAVASGSTVVTTITATSKLDPSVKRSKRVTVVSNDLSSSAYKVTLSGSAVYTGRSITPQVDVVMGGKARLEQGVDYSVEWRNNVNAGTAYCSVRGMGAFKGVKTTGFSIGKAPIGNARIVLSATSFAYDGKAKSPSVTVYDIGGRASAKLSPSADYTLSVRSVVTGTGYVTITARSGSQNFKGSVVRTFTVSAQPSRQMHRLYNPYSGEHFYTGDVSEKNKLTSLGWRYEGVGWNAPTTGTNVYRLYNRWTGDHHFTTNASEKDTCVRAGWTYEGVGWKSGGNVKVYREYNPYASCFYHNYTRDTSEHNHLCSVGWKSEGVGWYGV